MGWVKKLGVFYRHYGLSGLVLGWASFLRCRRGYATYLLVSSFASIALFVGVAVDWHRIVTIRQFSSQIVDGAALAIIQRYAQHESFSDIDERFGLVLKNFVTDYALAHGLPGHFKDDSFRVFVSGFPDHDLAIQVCVSGRVALTFMTVYFSLSDIFGESDRNVIVCGESKFELNRSEIVLVYDSSDSMGKPATSSDRETKIQVLERVTQSLLDSFPDNIWDEFIDGLPILRIGMVPFAGAVSLATRPRGRDVAAHWIERGNARWDWIDMEGESRYNSSKYLPLERGTSRIDIYERMGIGWNGCVEARPFPFDESDHPPDSLNPNTLWVPFLAPDEPDINNGGEGVYEDLDKRRLYAPLTCSNSVKNLFNNSYLFDTDRSPPDDEGLCAHRSFDREVSRFFMQTRFTQLDKYTAANSDFTQRHFDDFYRRSGLDRVVPMGSPFKHCSMTPIIELTNDKDRLKRIAGGIHSHLSFGTIIPAGLAWGWRVLSPEAPFVEGGSYSDRHLRKIMILMTDGRNGFRHSRRVRGETQFTNDAEFSLSPYLYYGYTFEDRRIGVGGLNSARHSIGQRFTALRARLERKTLSLCRSIRNRGIILYGITFGLEADQELIRDCVGSENRDRYFHAESGDELEAVFSRLSARLRSFIYVNK